MPINNVLNKTTDTFFVNPIIGGTANITANFTAIRNTIFTNGSQFTAFSQSAYNNINIEYIDNDTTKSSRIILAAARGTPAAPLDLNPAVDQRYAAIDFVGQGFSALFDYPFIDSYYATSNKSLEFSARGYMIASDKGGSITARLLRFHSLLNFDTGNTSLVVPLNINVSGFASNISGTIVSITRSANSTDNFIGLSHQNYSTSNIGANLVLLRSRSTTQALSTKVENNDEISQLVFAGADGTTTAKLLATIKCFADGTTGNNDVPGRIVYSTTPDASSTPSEAMRTDNAGRTTQVRQPSFSASLSADVANATGDGSAYVVALDTEQYDQGNNFATNTFTAPVAGNYRFNYIVSVDDLLVGHTKMEVTIGGVVVERCNPYALADSDGFYLCAGGIDLSLAASATVTMVVTVSGSTKTVTVKGTTTSGTFLSGQLQV